MTTIHADEITKLLKEQLTSFESRVEMNEAGSVVAAGDGVARIYGLRGARNGELLRFRNDVWGQAVTLSENSVGAVIFNDFDKVHDGDIVERTDRLVSVPIGEDLCGRIVDPLGRPLDGSPSVASDVTKPIESQVPAMLARQAIHEQLLTGIKAVDALAPIGLGQKMMIAGDRHTGKTSLAVDAIINQKWSNVYCVYVAIGQRQNDIARVVELFKQHHAIERTIVVAAAAGTSPAMRCAAPFTGITMAEYFRDHGKHVLVVVDDLTAHAAAYREVSLLIDYPVGIEAYPADMFYVHSRLLERAACLNPEFGGGSMTVVPIVETHNDDVSAVVTANVLSIVDGNIYLRSDLRRFGMSPAVDIRRSVSRVGEQAQMPAMKQCVDSLRVDLAHYRALDERVCLAQGTDQLTQKTRGRGQRLIAYLKQDSHKPVSIENQVVMLFAATRGYLDYFDVGVVARYEQNFYQFVQDKYPEILNEIKTLGAISAPMEERLIKICDEFEQRLSLQITT